MYITFIPIEKKKQYDFYRDLLKNFFFYAGVEFKKIKIKIKKIFF